MACFQNMHLGVWNVASISMRRGHLERGIVASPDDQGRWRVLTEPGLPTR